MIILASSASEVEAEGAQDLGRGGSFWGSFFFFLIGVPCNNSWGLTKGPFRV